MTVTFPICIMWPQLNGVTVQYSFAISLKQGPYILIKLFYSAQVTYFLLTKFLGPYCK